MKRTFSFLLITLCLLTFVVPIPAAPVLKRLQNEAETLVNATRLLEQKPFDKEAIKMRERSMRWLVETDKVSVSVCSLIISGVEEKFKYKSEVFTQYTMGMAALKLSHPDKASDEAAVQMGGIESALRYYEAVLKEKPNTKSAFLDDLLAKRAAGTLAEYAAVNNCKQKKETT